MKWFVAIVAIVTIGFLEAYALSPGINGTGFTMSMSLIAGLGGFMLNAKKRIGGKNG